MIYKLIKIKNNIYNKIYQPWNFTIIMLEIYIIIILSIILIIEEFYPFSFSKEENDTEEKINNKKAILIIPLSSLKGNSILEEYLDLENMELMDKYNSCFKLKKNKIEKCKDLYISKIENEMCEEIKEQVFGYNEQSLVDFGDIFNEENYIINENINNNILVNENFYRKEINNQSDNNDLTMENNYNNKDCVEYGLSDDSEEMIICTRYE